MRTVVAFVTGSAFLYFAQPTAGTVAISVALLVSAMVGRPFTQRFAHDFCPIDPAIMKRPLVRQFFIRISVLWATVLMLNAGLVFWLLVSSSLRSFVLERSVATYGLTAIAYLHFNIWVHGDDASRRHHRSMGEQPDSSLRSAILTSQPGSEDGDAGLFASL